MRKLLLTLLVTAFMMPAGAAMAQQCNKESTDPTDPNACAFEASKQQAVANDGIEIPVTDDKGNVTKYKPEIWKNLQAQPAVMTEMRANGCNPVAAALLQQEANLAMNKEVIAKAETGKVINLQDNLCYQMGRADLVNPVREQAKAINDGFMDWLGGLFGGAEGKKILDAAVKYNLVPMPGNMLEAKANNLIDQQCMKVASVQGNVIQNMNSQFGTTIMNGMTDRGFFTLKYDNSTAKPPVNTQNPPKQTSGGGSGGPVTNAVRLPATKPQTQQPAAKPAAPAQPQQNQQPTTPAPKRNIYQ